MALRSSIELEVKYAKLIRKYYPSIEMLRFVNTGSEATMSALRLARGFTGREKIVKVEGSFHGSHDAVLVKAGSGATTFGVRILQEFREISLKTLCRFLSTIHRLSQMS